MTADTTRREHSGSGIRLGIGSCPGIAKILPAGIRGITLPDGTRVRMLRCVTREGGADIPVALIPATGAVHNRMLGAAGGQIVEFCIALIFGGPSLFDWSTVACTRASFIITAIWWVAFTIPLLTSYRQVHYRATRDQLGSAVRGTFSELAGTFGKIVKNKPLWMFMIAFFFYIDAVNTVISMSTSYGAELGIDSTQLVVALLVTQFVAFPCAILYGRLAGRFGCKVMITAAVVAYMCIVFFAAFFLKSAVEFWILAILVGMFQGGIQALSRSYYGKIIPKDHANEYYGFYDIFGKTASIIGTFLVATTTSLTGNASFGVLSIAVLLVAALVFLLLQKDPTQA